jgi:hypothetical protein
MNETRTGSAVGFVDAVFNGVHDYAAKRPRQSLQYLP